jgi:hypothetical protein
MPDKAAKKPQKQLLHLVFGGRVTDPRGLEFQDVSELQIVGIYKNFAEAEKAWRAAAQRTVDDAEMKFVVVHIHKLLEEAVSPDEEDDEHA